MPRRPAATVYAAAAVACAGLLLAALALAGWRHWRDADLPTGDAEWIWAELPDRLPTPLAFYAVRDFTLDAVPGAGGGEAAGGAAASGVPDPGAAELRLLADEEYVVWLNGQRIGSNRYRPGAPLDVYRVGDLLLPGPNRLIVELRSSRGAGGLLAALVAAVGEGGDRGNGDEDGGGVAAGARGEADGAAESHTVVAPGAARELVVSDRSWRIVRRRVPGLVEGWAPVPGDERAISWGRPPTGRWPRPETGPTRPRLAAVGEPCAAVAGQRGGDGEPATPQRMVFDWGREVVGYLLIARPPDAPTATPTVSLFAVGDAPPRPLDRTARALPLVTLPGEAVWTDVVPRRFRYAAVVGLEGPLAASVLPLSPDALAELPGATTGEAAEPTVLGLQRPRRTPAEDAVRRRLAEAKEGGGNR